MNLKEFISKTTSDIIEGLDCASNQLKDKNKEIGLYSPGESDQRHIEFDVAVVTSGKTGSSKSANGEIKVWGIIQGGGKNKKNAETSNATTSRIKFGIRVKDIKKLT